VEKIDAVSKKEDAGEQGGERAQAGGEETAE
jgi:hypothetical protein